MGKTTERQMSNETAILILIISAFSLFGGVLGWATWDYSRTEKQKKSENPGQ